MRKGRLAAVLMRRALTVGLLVAGLLVLLMLLLLASDQRTSHAYRALLPPPPQQLLSMAGDDGPKMAGDDSDNCVPRDSIFFLKTHKCASSTVQNILMRYGEKHSLNFVLGSTGNYVGSPTPFNRLFIPDWLWPRSGKFDVFAHHTRLHVAETRRVMQDHAAWVTILRDPVAQFESAFDYYHFAIPQHWNMTLRQFIALPLERKQALARIGHGRFGGSQMAFDLGYDPAIVSEPRLVQAMLDDLDKAFDLVMIAEMMDESLVLLRQLMCWSTDDVIYLTKNARFDALRTPMSRADRAALEEFLELDMILYRHFRQRLAQQIAAVPIATFLARTEALVARCLHYKQRCVASEAKGSELQGQQHEITDRVKGYRLIDSSDWMCSRLGMAEIGYTDLLRDGQRQRMAIWRRVYGLLGMDVGAPQQPEERT
ncbi:galactosylceramide sulfotransferase-like isoform X2 [Pollicipes pollicipes]|uniref:galactosylceramide sulfotransferase-like isoform X2 n=1 Tax=Pollicipes pollicipes TaxID=41117 RepID=UPI0018857E04|nr:galactosylceramide sulfotransferase-like isoform X2 [Pollicipes pollicipes]